MGFWSSIKKAAKWVVQKVKTVVRVVVKYAFGLLMRFINLLGSWIPVEKKMRIQVFILYDGVTPVHSVPDTERAVNDTVALFKDKFNIKLKSYAKIFVQEITKPAPNAALNVTCDASAYWDEFGDSGEFFAANLAGWNAIPISVNFPISIFIVKSIAGKIGCSIPIADYVVLSPQGVVSTTTMSHELGHTCLLFHRSNQKNLMYSDSTRGTDVTKWQRYWVRSSRHCTFW